MTLNVRWPPNLAIASHTVSPQLARIMHGRLANVA